MTTLIFKSIISIIFFTIGSAIGFFIAESMEITDLAHGGYIMLTIGIPFLVLGAFLSHKIVNVRGNNS